jgi:hypothetical protein
MRRMTRHPVDPDESLEEISPEGALAARVFALSLVGGGAVLVVAAWDELWRRCGVVMGVCVERAAGAVMIVAVAIAAVLIAVAVLRRVRRRVRDVDGSSRYVWAVGALFAAGAVLIAPRIPAWTCARGRFDPLLEECLHPPTTSDPASWLLLKQAVVLVGLVGGFAIAASPRRIRWLAPVAVAAWAGGLGWVALDALA